MTPKIESLSVCQCSMLPFLVTLFHRTLFCSQIIDILELLPSLNLNLSPDRDLRCPRCTNQGADHRRHDRCWAGCPFFSTFSFSFSRPELSRFPFLFHLLSCIGWCTIFVLRRQILASLEEEICGVSPLSSSPCPSSFSGSTATRSSLSTPPHQVIYFTDHHHRVFRRQRWSLQPF